MTDIIPRHKPDNPFKYTNIQIAERSKALKDMERDYPNLPYAWLELTYDFVHKCKCKDEVDEIIDSGKWETKPPLSCA